MSQESSEGWVIVHLDALLRARGMTATELSARIGITQANVSILRTGKAKAMRFATLLAICNALDCQPGDLLSIDRDPQEEPPSGAVRVGAGGFMLINTGPQEIAVVKMLRDLGDLELSEAVHIVTNAPCRILVNLDKADLELAMVKLRQAGATIEPGS